jgi:hypothetical protein
MRLIAGNYRARLLEDHACVIERSGSLGGRSHQQQPDHQDYLGLRIIGASLCRSDAGTDFRG